MRERRAAALANPFARCAVPAVPSVEEDPLVDDDADEVDSNGDIVPEFAEDSTASESEDAVDVQEDLVERAEIDPLEASYGQVSDDDDDEEPEDQQERSPLLPADAGPGVKRSQAPAGATQASSATCAASQSNAVHLPPSAAPGTSTPEKAASKKKAKTNFVSPVGLFKQAVDLDRNYF